MLVKSLYFILSYVKSVSRVLFQFNYTIVVYCLFNSLFSYSLLLCRVGTQNKK